MARTQAGQKGPKVEFKNLEKVFFPGNGFTKGDLIKYYIDVAPLLLPHFRDRPVTRIRMPDGVHGERFYEKNAPGYAPAWIPRTQVPREEGGAINYIMLQDAETLAWVANDAAVELHPFLHRAEDISRPTQIAFDLDPGEGADLLTCIEVGWIVRELLQQFRLKAFPKVTGSKGLQIYVPLNTPVTYDSVTPFARNVAEALNRAKPDLIVSNMLKTLRVNKVLIDWSQNHEKKTTVGAYSIRGKRDEPFVSTPVTWEELKRAEKAGSADALFFPPAAVLKRVQKLGDLFAPVLKLKQRLPAQFVLKAPNKPRSAAKVPAHPIRSHQGSRRRFVVHQLGGRKAGYELRLENGETLKSWILAKGVPTKSGEPRPALAGHDLPLDQLESESPALRIWDIGTFDTMEGGFGRRAWKVFLTGKRLRGEWTLERPPAESADGGWVLTKTGGDHRSLGEKTAVRAAPPPNYPEPAFLEPMLARSVAALPVGDEWSYEIKWDGYRVLAIKHGDAVQLLSRKGNNLNRDFPTVVQAIKALPVDTAVIDGEVVALDRQGRPSFQMLQHRSGAEGFIVDYAFDLLQVDGKDWSARPLEERKARLREIVAGSDVRFSESLPGDPAAIVQQIQQLRLEGIVAKRRRSAYKSGDRSGDWVKFKLSPEQEFVIGGFKPGSPLESLVVGYYEGKNLICAGKVRQGLNPRNRRELHHLLEPLLAATCAFANLPNSEKSHWGEGITAGEMQELRWVKPKIVAQISFVEWTRGGNLRHGEFKGLRPDKAAKDVHREVPT